MDDYRLPLVYEASKDNPEIGLGYKHGETPEIMLLMDGIRKMLMEQGNPVMNDSMSGLDRLFARPQNVMNANRGPTFDQGQVDSMRDPAKLLEKLKLLQGMNPAYLPRQWQGVAGKYRM